MKLVAGRCAHRDEVENNDQSTCFMAAISVGSATIYHASKGWDELTSADSMTNALVVLCH